MLLLRGGALLRNGGSEGCGGGGGGTRTTASRPLPPPMVRPMREAGAAATAPRAAASSKSGGSSTSTSSSRHSSREAASPSASGRSSSHVSSGAIGSSSSGRTATASNGGSMSWRVCSGSAPMLQPDDVSLTPDPPHHGRTMAINVTGTTPVSTPGGTFTVAVSYLGVRVYSFESRLCDAVPCPLQAGAPFRLQVSQKLPVLAPPGPYTMEITGDAEGGGRFMCVAISFNVAAPGSSSSRSSWR